MDDLPDFMMAKDGEPGFIDERCQHCNARLYRNEHGRAICLNACHLPGHLYRMLQNPVAFEQAFGKPGKDGDYE